MATGTGGGLRLRLAARRLPWAFGLLLLLLLLLLLRALRALRAGLMSQLLLRLLCGDLLLALPPLLLPLLLDLDCLLLL